MDNGPDYDWTSLWNMLPQKAQADLVNPTAKAIGDGLGGIFTWIFHKPIEYQAVERAKVESLKHMVAEKISKIPESKMTFKNRGLILKALEDSKYSLDSEELREYFASLIANAANKDKAYNISPYFSTILSNLSVQDALFLKKFESHGSIKDSIGIIRVNIFPNSKNTEFNTVQKDLVLVSEVQLTSYSEQMDTLESLGILKRIYGKYSLSVKPQLKRGEDIIMHAYPSFSREQLKIENGNVELTELGKSFANIVLL